jgi:hypothetical protein
MHPKYILHDFGIYLYIVQVYEINGHIQKVIFRKIYQRAAFFQMDATYIVCIRLLYDHTPGAIVTRLHNNRNKNDKETMLVSIPISK